MSSRLSVCLLTRDEEQHVGRAVGSVAGVADEVVVADTGSTDRTAEVARGHGARVVAVGWDDDFAAGRNAALGAATGDWVLWLNPDEELLPESHAALRAAVGAGDDTFGGFVRVRNVPDSARPGRFTESGDLRLYRRRPDARYVGRLHPTFPPELGRALADAGEKVVPTGVVLLRHGDASVLDGSKLRWAVRLLERELADRPGQLPYLVEYGRNLLLLNDPKGHEVMAEAVEQVLTAVENPLPPGPGVAELLEYVLNTPPERSRARMTRDEAAGLALRWFPDTPPLLWAIAGALFRAGQFAPAAGLLERLVHLGRTDTYDHSQWFDPRIVGPWAVLNLGQCFRATGRPDKAREHLLTLADDPEFGPQAAAQLAEIQGVTGG